MADMLTNNLADSAKFINDLHVQLDRQKSLYGSPVVIYTAVVEKFCVGHTQGFDLILDNLKSISNSKGLTCWFVFHTTAKPALGHRNDTIFIDTWAWVTYKNSIKRHRTKWYSNSNKALFLVGKPFKIQRIGLLNEFYKSNTLNYLDYTFHYPSTQENRDKIKQLLPNIGNDMYIDQLLCELQKPSMDIDLHKQTVSTGFEYTGFPTDLRYYRNTCLSIVSENSFEFNPNISDVPYLTEKLFRSIVNYHPFILLGDVGIEDYLENLGYKTFNKFFLPTNNNILSNSFAKIKWAAASVKHFIDNRDKHINEIRDITNHNHNVFMNNVNQEITQFHRMFPDVNIDHTELLGNL